METSSLPTALTSTSLRCGKWTLEEEKYASQIIENYDNGCLEAAEGTRLRTYLAKALHCDPMRISKKFTKYESTGKKLFIPLIRSPENSAFIEESRKKLQILRDDWVKQLRAEEEWNLKKAASRPQKNIALNKQDNISTSPFSKDLPTFSREVEMRKRLVFVLPDLQAVEFTLLSIRNFFRFCHQTPTSADVEQAILRQELGVRTLHAIVSSGCCLVDDSMLQHFHRAVVNYMFSLRQPQQAYPSFSLPPIQSHLIGALPLLNKSKTKVLNPFPKSGVSSSESSDDSYSLRPTSSATEVCTNTSDSVENNNSTSGNSNHNSANECNSNSIGEGNGETYSSQSDENGDSSATSSKIVELRPRVIVPPVKLSGNKNPRSDTSTNESTSTDEYSREMKRLRKILAAEKSSRLCQMPKMEAVSDGGMTTTSGSMCSNSVVSPHSVLTGYLNSMKSMNNNQLKERKYDDKGILQMDQQQKLHLMHHHKLQKMHSRQGEDKQVSVNFEKYYNEEEK